MVLRTSIHACGWDWTLKGGSATASPKASVETLRFWQVMTGSVRLKKTARAQGRGPAPLAPPKPTVRERHPGSC